MLRGLHKLCDKGQWDSAIHQLRQNPACRSTATSRGGYGEWTPLHIACKRNPPVELIVSLLEAAPEAACLNDTSQRHPLHHAAEWGANVDILATLYDAHPRSVLAMDNDGRTPLHLALMRSQGGGEMMAQGGRRSGPPSQLEVELLLDGGEENVAGVRDNEGNTALHCACHNIDDFVEIDVLTTLVNHFPEALLMKNAEGHTPLHLALLKSIEMPLGINALKLLMGCSIGREEEVLRMEDEEGRLPLHCACKNFASFEVLHELILPNREAALTKAHDGTYPLDVLEEMRPSVVSEEEMEELNYKSDLLFAHNPDILPYRTESKRLERMEDLIVFEAQNDRSLSVIGANIWIWLCTFPQNDDQGGVYATCVKHITEKLHDPDTVRMLADIKTPEGIPVRDAASARSAEMLQPYFRFADDYEFMDPSTGMNDPIHETETSLVVRVREHLNDTTNVADGSGAAVSATSTGSAGAQSRVVAMKFESDAAAFEKEIMMHKQLYGIAGIVPLVKNFDVNRIGTRNEEPGDALFAQSLARRGGTAESMPYDLDPYHHALVYPLGDKTLEEVWRHERNRGIVDVKSIFRDLGNVLKEIHNRNVMHGNLHPGNVVRMTGGRYELTGVAEARQIPSDHLGGNGAAFGGRDGWEGCCGIKTGLAPPEMFTKIHSEMALLKYKKYYRTVIDDSTTYENFTSLSNDEIGMIGELVDQYLLTSTGRFQQASFTDVWYRFTVHSRLWKIIRPHTDSSSSTTDGPSGTSTVVPKTFRINHQSPLPHRPQELPYQIQCASASYDIWTFGLLIYQHFAGTPLFRRSNRDFHLVSDADYIRLCDWSPEDLEKAFASERPIDDPLVRDLLRKVLIPREAGRLETMDDLLAHPYFDPDGSEEAEMLREQILHNEEEVRVTKAREEREKKEKEAWKKAKTVTMDLVSMDVLLKLSRSTGMRWKTLLSNTSSSAAVESSSNHPSIPSETSNSDIAMFPTSYVVLPYELDGSDGSATQPDAARMLSLRLAEVLHATTLLAEMSKRHVSRDTKDLLKRKVKEYLDYNNGFADENKNNSNNTMSNSDPTISNSNAALSTCEWILQRASNAERALTSILSYYLPEDDDNKTSITLLSASVNAKKIVANILPHDISLEDCAVTVKRARDAESAFAALERITPQNLDVVRRTYYDECFSHLDPHALGALAEEKANIDNALLDIIKKFAADGIDAIRKLLSDRTMELLELYYEEGYLYLVDEYTGKPMVERNCGGFYGVVENVRDYLPGMRLTLKTVTSCGDILGGLKNAVGLATVEQMDEEWQHNVAFCTTTTGRWRDDIAERNEYALFNEMIYGQTGGGVVSGGCRPSEDWERWERYVSDRDPAREYAGLKCHTVRDGSYSMWAADTSYVLMEDCRMKSLNDYAERIETEKRNKLQEELKNIRNERSKHRAKGEITQPESEDQEERDMHNDNHNDMFRDEYDDEPIIDPVPSHIEVESKSGLDKMNDEDEIHDIKRVPSNDSTVTDVVHPHDRNFSSSRATSSKYSFRSSTPTAGGVRPASSTNRFSSSSTRLSSSKAGKSLPPTMASVEKSDNPMNGNEAMTKQQQQYDNYQTNEVTTVADDEFSDAPTEIHHAQNTIAPTPTRSNTKRTSTLPRRPQSSLSTKSASTANASPLPPSSSTTKATTAGRLQPPPSTHSTSSRRIINPPATPSGTTSRFRPSTPSISTSHQRLGKPSGAGVPHTTTNASASKALKNKTSASSDDSTTASSVNNHSVTPSTSRRLRSSSPGPRPPSGISNTNDSKSSTAANDAPTPARSNWRANTSSESSLSWRSRMTDRKGPPTHNSHANNTVDVDHNDDISIVTMSTIGTKEFHSGPPSLSMNTADINGSGDDFNHTKATPSPKHSIAAASPRHKRISSPSPRHSSGGTMAAPSPRHGNPRHSAGGIRVAPSPRHGSSGVQPNAGSSGGMMAAPSPRHGDRRTTRASTTSSGNLISTRTSMFEKSGDQQQPQAPRPPMTTTNAGSKPRFNRFRV